MTPERYRALRETVGTRREVAKLWRCSPVTVRLRESGHQPITAEAAEQALEAVYELALAEDTRRERVRARRMRWLEEAEITPKHFRTALRALGLRTRTEAALSLLADDSPASLDLISRWRTGRTAIPWWIARNLRAALELGEGDPWPSGMTHHEVVIDL